MTPPLEVVKVALILVGLALKRNLAIGIAAPQQAHQPLGHIPHIESDDAHLKQLSGVDALMVNEFLRQVNTWMNKQYAQQIDGTEPAHRNVFGPYNFHYLGAKLAFFPHILHCMSN